MASAAALARQIAWLYGITRVALEVPAAIVNLTEDVAHNTIYLCRRTDQYIDGICPVPPAALESRLHLLACAHALLLHDQPPLE